MAKYITSDLIEQLENDVNAILQRAEALKAVRNGSLKLSPAKGTWSIIQVVEHLNSYNRYYLPEIEKALQKGRVRRLKANRCFSPGMLGNYFTNMMLPGADNTISKKYKAPKDHTPPMELDISRVLNEFIEGQNRLLDFLHQGAHTDLGKLKVPVSINRLIKLKLGDTFRFLIGHQQRHFVQIEVLMMRRPVLV